MQAKDEIIIQSLKNNKEEALNEIFQLYFKRLYSFSIQFVADKEIAREIVHDALLRFWQHRKYLRDNTNIKAYLFKIIRNLCLNYLKKIKNHPEELFGSDDMKYELELNYEVLVDNDWDKLLTNEFESVLYSIIDSLPEKCRDVFRLSRFEQKSNAEIADQLNISVKTVEGHITEAIKIIRHKITKYLAIILFLIIP